MQRITHILIMLVMALSLYGMDFGLKFKSHDFPPKQRTSINLGDKPFKFKTEFKIGFFYNFYTTPMFGNILTLNTNDGQRVSIGASMIDDGSFRISLVINDHIYFINQSIELNPSHEDHLTLWLDKTDDKVFVQLYDLEVSYPMNLKNTDSVTPLFGLESTGKGTRHTDVAPIILRNARIFIDGVNTNHWDFKYHDSSSTTPDNMGDQTAKITNPHWLIDDHTDWEEIYSLNVRDKIQTSFDPVKEQIYIIYNDKIVSFDPVRSDSSVISVNGGNRIMAYSNHIACNPASNTLINYNLTRRNSAVLNLSTGIWNNSTSDEKEEPNYSNHAVAISGDTLFAFGGYGFYKFHNDLFTVNLETGEIKEHKLTPALMPMTSPSAAVVDGKLYILGGKGNDTGRQELPSSHHYALYEYDTTTWQGKKIWELDSVQYDFLPSQSMYFDKQEDCFYVAATSQGGELISVSRTKPEIKSLSTPIRSKMDFHDFVFDLYRSSDGKRYYLIIDKRLDPQNHELKIYTITAPFISDPKLITDKITTTIERHGHTSGGGARTLWIIAIIFAVAAGIGALTSVRRRKNAKTSKPDTPMLPDTDITVRTDEPLQDDVKTEMSVDAEDFSFITFAEQDNDSHSFDRSKSSISFLGGFCVRDKEGNDITVKFTARLKHLLIMLLLSSLKYESGIKYQMIDEEIWGDKDEKSAQNNRNVSMRKLRMLLEEVGNVVINYDKGFFKIETNDVMFDYKELTSRIAEIKGEESVRPELVNQILELLLMGPMLPNTQYDWLDQYKSEFSNSALELLTKLLKYELGRDDNLAYRIAETISLHDMLNEDALYAKCQVLSRRKMLGIAKNIHSKFCKEYLMSMGEEYPVSFADACKKEL